MEFWKMVACRHATTTDPNELGDALCADCGTIVRVKLTNTALRDAVERVRRDQVHSMRCVDTPDGWICADDCPQR